MNGYIQIDMNGTPVGLKFAYPAIKGFIEACVAKPGVYDDESESGVTFEGIAKLIQQGYVNNCIIKEVEPSITYEQFYTWMEEANETDEGRATLSQIMQIFADSYITKRIIKAAEEKKSQLKTA